MAIHEEIEISRTQQDPPCTSNASPPSQDHRFEKLRGVRWRINLGILPSSPSSTIDELRRVTADSRRRYAALRRRLLIDPHLPKKGTTSSDLTIDNPLSQNPDSTWGRFFRNAELEKTLDQDLSRLYPEHGSYFQSSGCQGMLRRILLLWCLKHPEIGYRQGMHELLAPLLYVLQVDVQYLTDVRSNYEDQFIDLFDELAFQERDSGTYDFDIKKVLDDSMEEEEEDGASSGGINKKKKPKSFDELDNETQTAVLLSDAYGAEGELGIVLSDKFMEHDAYTMFDALMYGGSSLGSVSVANFFVYSAPNDSVTGLPPVIEASGALYHLLSLVDASLHSHLVELGVEPQYFALRWLRVLFGREFPLYNLLIVWDEIFSADNSEVERGVVEAGLGFEFRILSSPRGALVAGMAVSMILYLRSSLLATENATSSLKRLLNFPEEIDLSKVIEKAKTLQSLALEINARRDLIPKGSRKQMRGHSLSVDSISLGSSPVGIVPESYWEEKWRVLNSPEEEERKQKALLQRPKAGKKSWSERVKQRLSRTESDPSPAEANKSGNKPPIRRSLLDDLSRQLGEKEIDPPELPNLDTDIERSSTVSDSLSLDYEENNSDRGKSENHTDLPLSVPENEPETTSGMSILRERNIFSGKLQMLWRLGRNLSGEETSETKEAKPIDSEDGKTDSDSTAGNGDALKNTGRSMLEHIKVIESVLELSSPENMTDNGRLTVEEALRELRRLGNMLLSEM
ncbi:PREDICTED: TBC1 domain family member 5 homolog B-like [Camelina sativa]|uniref:TBC1 domain family member 5 homolog B-like n=1 Tax=Camelina sativa TaxID=90675 RepID=A0ABM0UMP3_CAMSA|nr:PREDICTED: TBC1 domain family member 5 homolog B-like [Camelina sativa]